jgi:two-component system, LytTR family, sensor kinase
VATGAQEENRLEIVLGGLLGGAITASLFAGWRFLLAPRGVIRGEGRAMQASLHAATATLPHLRLGLRAETAEKAVPHLRALTGARALALADRSELLAIDGTARGFRQGDPIGALFDEGADDRVHLSPRVELGGLGEAACVVAPLVVREERIGSLAAFFVPPHRVEPEDMRVVSEAASLVGAQVELAAIDEQEERLARAELGALRAQISPHFIYNALAAVAGYIHSQPEHARELLTDFADFTRYAFGRDRSYVTLADELQYVEKYLSLERARFSDRLEVRLEVAPEILPAVVPVLSLQPLVENAVRHGIEVGPEGGRRIEITGTDLGMDAAVTVRDEGIGMTPEQVSAALNGLAGGIGLSNVHRRLRTTFGPEYGLSISSEPGEGTEVTLVIPKSHPGVRAGPALAEAAA